MNVGAIRTLNPPSTIGIVGGGQLGKMITQEAKRMGYNVLVLDPTPNSPAGQIADYQIVASFSDLAAMEQLSFKSDVVTYEFEHINVDMLDEIKRSGCAVYPSPETLRVIQNKYIQKRRLRKIGVPVPDFCIVNKENSIDMAFKKLGSKIIIKTCKGGYDGKGNFVAASLKEGRAACSRFEGHPIMAEEYVDYLMEVSIIVCRNHNGFALYPISENEHKESILRRSLIPARISGVVENKVRDIAKSIMDEIDDYGVFCIECFVDKNENVLVNEIAPRPHNSGHYTIEGCKTSQFEQLVRIVTGMPLGSTELRAPCAMYNILGDEKVSGEYEVTGLDGLLKIDDCHPHLYGKMETKPLKKIGHVTALSNVLEEADQKARLAIGNICIKARAL